MLPLLYQTPVTGPRGPQGIPGLGSANYPAVSDVLAANITTNIHNNPFTISSLSLSPGSYLILAQTTGIQPSSLEVFLFWLSSSLGTHSSVYTLLNSSGNVFTTHAFAVLTLTSTVTIIANGLFTVSDNATIYGNSGVTKSSMMSAIKLF